MNDRTHYVLKGFLNLSDNEKQELIDALNEYLKQSAIKQRDFEFTERRVVLGPLTSGCPCCGRR